MAHNKLFSCRHFESKAIFQYLIIHWNPKLVLVLALVYLKVVLVVFVRDAVPNFWPKHHLTAFHIITHDIVKFRHQSLLVYNVKLNTVVCSNLNPNITLYVVY